MIAAADIKWGSYGAYEGAYFRGSRQFVRPPNPTPAAKALDVVVRTEGGSPDAVNAYDRCIISTALVQWCEAGYFLTSKLLGVLAESNSGLLEPIRPALEASGADFVKNANGKWRFRFRDARGEVDTIQEQQQLFLLHSTGLKGTWDDASKDRVKLWVSCLANALNSAEAERIQIEYTAPRLLSFATPEAKALLWGEQLPDEEWIGALRTGFLSFAGNLPAVATKHLLIAASTTKAPKWSKEWCISVLKELTFGPNIAIYPGRYNKIRGPLEQNYGVDLPDFAEELRAWEAAMNKDVGPVGEGEPAFTALNEIQELLVSAGYDLGPAGADGRYGSKTRDAIMTFQRLNGLFADGQVGVNTRKALIAAWRKLNQR